MVFLHHFYNVWLNHQFIIGIGWRTIGIDEEGVGGKLNWENEGESELDYMWGRFLRNSDECSCGFFYYVYFWQLLTGEICSI